MQQRLAELNPHMADAVRRASSAASSSGISNRAAYERALRVGTAADARKVAAGEGAEQVGCEVMGLRVCGRITEPF